MVLTVAIVGAAGAVGTVLDQMYSATSADVMQAITGTVEVTKGNL
jgi:Flp pilus assembly pilin Flp